MQAPAVPVQMDVTDENNTIARFIGAPVPLFNPGPERPHINVYNLFKPAILHFFYLMNHATDKDDTNNFIYKNDIINIMRMIRLQNGSAFLQNAHIKGLIVTPFSPGDDYYERWFDDVFPGEAASEDFKLSIITQGGEVVNLYSFYKYENVPTHDADTRVLVGDFFNYIVLMADVDDTAKLYMHKYRFLIAFGLAAYLDNYETVIRHNSGVENENADEDNLITKFGFNPDIHTFRFVPKLRGYNFRTLINNTNHPRYDIANDINIARLLDIIVEIEREDTNAMVSYGIVDVFCPYKRPDTDPEETRVGQSDNIFSFFYTPQASAIANPSYPLVPEGHVPSVDFQIKLPAILPMLGDKEFTVRILPHGYILFETLRMLYVSDALERNGYDSKFEKYKQKLTALMGTLMDTNLSEYIFIQCKAKKSKDDTMAGILAGGRLQPEVQKIEPTQLTLPTKATMNLPIEMNQPSEEEQQARRYSLQLLKEESLAIEKGYPFEFPKRETLSPIQQRGYLDYLSYQFPEMKDYRLPMLPEEYTKTKQIKKGGYRKTTLKKNKHKARRITPRK